METDIHGINITGFPKVQLILVSECFLSRKTFRLPC